jgi:hypothetical protein
MRRKRCSGATPVHARYFFLLFTVALVGCMSAPPTSPIPTVPSFTSAPPTSTAGVTPNVEPTASVIPLSTHVLASPTPIPISPTRAATQTAAVPTATSLSTTSPTPAERLVPNGPPRDPGPLDWAHPGPYLGNSFNAADITSLPAKRNVVVTYYFYWHDLTDPARRARSLQFFGELPARADSYSYASPATHQSEFEDMQAAGIDAALPVYWGEPGHPGRDFNPTVPHHWSTEGIPPMVAALDAMASAGHPFKIGMFYDTTILANADLTTAAGKEYFYINVRDFYSRVPPRYWAAIGGKPIVWLYDTQWVSKFDQASLDYLSDRFAQDFGGLRPFVSREYQWYQSKGVTPAAILKSDAVYSWGAAPSGYNSDSRLSVAEVGPGFSNTRYCKGGAAANCFDVSRENGAFYERELRSAIQSGRLILAVETWNEFSEGSDIADTDRFGRTYINLTRRYADVFHAKSAAG